MPRPAVSDGPVALRIPTSRGPVPQVGQGSGASRSASGTGWDALVAGSVTGHLLWQNSRTGDRGFWPLAGAQPAAGWIPLTTIGLEWRIACTADFNGDGRHDVLWQNTSTGDWGFWLLDGVNASAFGYVPLTVIAPAWRVVACADVNGDSHPDLLWSRPSTGELGFWLMNGMQPAGGGYIPLTTIDRVWQVAALADFSGDGKPDILWQNLTTGDRGFWRLDGTSPASGWIPLTVIGPEWEISLAADANGDGKSDILWRNATTAERGWWYLDGMTQGAGGYVPMTTLDAEWVATSVLPNPPPSDPTTVVSVVLTGASSRLLLVGDSVRLNAIGLNSAGEWVTSARATWSSSATRIAVVRDDGMVVGLGGGRVTITARMGDRDASVTLDVADGAIIPVSGGALVAERGAASLSVPAGGVATPTLVTMRRSLASPLEPRVVPMTVWEMGPDAVIVRGYLTLSYDEVQVPRELARESLQLYLQGASGWSLVPGSTVNLQARTVSGWIGRGGVYAIRSTPVDQVVIRGDAVGAALYVGQSASLNVKLVSANGDSLPPRAMSWSSSDPTHVMVDTGGTITAVAPGSATISAATDGKIGTAVVTVLARPATDLSRATDWTTLQGNAQHTGAIDATLDGFLFRPRWVKVLGSSYGFVPPSVGGGRVYVRGGAYAAAGALVALNPADGAQLWIRSFPTSDGSNQATWNAGTLYTTTGGHEDTFMWSLNDGDGSLRFQAPFASQWDSWKAPVVAGSTVVTAGGYYGGMYGFDTGTGAQTFFLSGPQVDSWAPAARDGIVYRTGYSGSEGALTLVQPSTGAIVAQVFDARLRGVATPVLGPLDDALVLTAGRVVAVNVGSRSVSWDASASFVGLPVVGGGRVYAFTATEVIGLAESTGTRQWSWSFPLQNSPTPSALLLTNNLLFVSVRNAGTGMTYAVDLASGLAVWRYPLGGQLAMGREGVLYISGADRLAAIDLR